MVFELLEQLQSLLERSHAPFLECALSGDHGIVDILLSTNGDIPKLLARSGVWNAWSVIGQPTKMTK